jgi:hypothetical protein
MMTTGYDCQDILNLAMLRPIFSPTDFIQIKGRGTRPYTFQYQREHGAQVEEIAVKKETFKLFDFFANCEYFEEEFDYDEVLKLPLEARMGPGGGDLPAGISDDYVTSNAFRTMYSGIPGTYILETVWLAGAYLVKWFVDTFTDFETVGSAFDLTAEEILDNAASKIPPGAQGLMLVPYWNSAMNPYWDASASGIMVGWRGFHQRAHMYRAILEGIAFEQRLHTEGVESALGRKIDRYIAVGGGAGNALWCQIIADITGKTVFRTPTKEATSLGSAILAASGGGIYKDIQEAAQNMTQIDPQPFTPNEERQGLYDQLYGEVYLDLYPKLQNSLARLTKLSTSLEEQQNEA